MITTFLPITNALSDNSYYSEKIQGNKLHPLTKAIAICLTATNMNMLFSKQDMFEFLVRVQLAFPFLKIDEHFKNSNHLFCFSENEDAHKMCVEDVYSHIGIRMSNALNNTEREIFINEINSNVSAAVYHGEMLNSNFSELLKQQMKNNDLPLTIDEHKVRSAEEIAALLMKVVENNKFNDISEIHAIISSCKNLDKKNKEFDVDKIDKDILNEFYEHISNICEFDSIEELMNKEPRKVENLLLVAWLYANKKLMMSNIGEYVPDLAYQSDIDYSEMIIENDFLPTLNEVIDYYKLDSFSEKLKTI
jgi:hypothetical protein